MGTFAASTAHWEGVDSTTFQAYNSGKRKQLDFVLISRSLRDSHRASWREDDWEALSAHIAVGIDVGVGARKWRRASFSWGWKCKDVIRFRSAIGAMRNLAEAQDVVLQAASSWRGGSRAAASPLEAIIERLIK